MASRSLLFVAGLFVCTPSAVSGTHAYDCDPVNNFFYAGFNSGPALNDEGLIDNMKDLTERQMRILRPKSAKGVRHFYCTFEADLV